MIEDQKLIGDRIEAALKKMHADRITNVIEKVTKRPCKCKQRKEFLNKLHIQMREMQNRILQEQKRKVK